jgi:hypothetical protein
MRVAGHVARMEDRLNATDILDGKLQFKRSFGRYLKTFLIDTL